MLQLIFCAVYVRIINIKELKRKGSFNMRKVLMIANQFPPMGGSGVQRSVKFVKHLHKFGYQPIVLTRDVGNMLLRDESLLDDVPEGTEIIRTKPYDFTEWQSVFKIFGKILGLKVFIPDSAWLWYKMSRKAALDTIKKHNIKVIYTTSAPYSDHLLGLYIKRALPDIRWVVDFRDEWTNNPYTLDNPYNPFRTKIEKGMERTVIENADLLITNTPVMRENFLALYDILPEKFYVIPNGYDEEDFTGLDLTQEKNQKLTFTYTGALYGRRKPDTFFDALKQLITEKKIDGTQIAVKLIGNYHKDKLQAQINSYGLTEQFEIVGYVPHGECIKRQLASDVLVLIEGTGRGSDAFYTGKIFEYMNTGRPVLAILPENGAAAGLVRKTKIGIVAHTDNVEKIKSAVLKYYNDWQQGTLVFSPNREEIEKYERKALTKQLAEIFDLVY